MEQSPSVVSFTRYGADRLGAARGARNSRRRPGEYLDSVRKAERSTGDRGGVAPKARKPKRSEHSIVRDAAVSGAIKDFEAAVRPCALRVIAAAHEPRRAHRHTCTEIGQWHAAACKACSACSSRDERECTKEDGVRVCTTELLVAFNSAASDLSQRLAKLALIFCLNMLVLVTTDAGSMRRHAWDLPPRYLLCNRSVIVACISTSIATGGGGISLCVKLSSSLANLVEMSGVAYP